MANLKGLKKPRKWKYKIGQLLYAPTTDNLGIVCYRITRAYGIQEYFVKWFKSAETNSYHLESELEYWAKEYNKLVNK